MISYCLTNDTDEKVCIIIDINKCKKLITGEILTPDEFDILYDMNKEDLNKVLDRNQSYIIATHIL
jgi:uncharacterized protein YwgA